MYRKVPAAAAVTVCLLGTAWGFAAAGAGANPSSGAGRAAQAAKNCPLPKFGPGKNYHPTIHPADFSPNITNKWSPFPVGTTFVYSGVDGTDHITDIVSPSHRTKVLDGVRARVINDRVLVHGRVSERTSDYYAQDKCGNVWYFGEDTAELNRHGKVISRQGSFHSGVHGAQPGVYMQAHPQLGRKFRQEWYKGHAEDVFKAIQKHQSRTTPYASFKNLLRTRETDGLEPSIVDNKYFAPGIGSVVELTVKGATERLHLVDVLR
jgi:hypothetical protein